jgi:hypothetical protein
MDPRLRTVLWVLSSLAVIWTILTLGSLSGMVPTQGMMDSDAMNRMMGGDMMHGGMMVGMTIYMALNAIVMLGMDGIFIYLVMTARHGGQHAQT